MTPEGENGTEGSGEKYTRRSSKSNESLLERFTSVQILRRPISLVARNSGRCQGIQKGNFLFLLLCDTSINEEGVSLGVHVLHSYLETRKASSLRDLNFKQELLRNILQYNAVTANTTTTQTAIFPHLLLNSRFLSATLNPDHNRGGHCSSYLRNSRDTQIHPLVYLRRGHDLLENGEVPTKRNTLHLRINKRSFGLSGNKVQSLWVHRGRLWLSRGIFKSLHGSS